MAKIILIDDEENARVLTAQFLELAGHQVVTEENGIQGHERALESAFDLVITDIIMPEKEGFETIKDLKRERPDLPILAISGGGVIQSDELLEMAVSMGASAGLSKPFTGKALLAAVQKALDLGA